MTHSENIPNPAKAKEFFEAKMAFTTGPVELSHQLKGSKKVNVIDVRAAEDYSKGHIPGAINLAAGQWDSLSVLKKEMVNVIYCYSQVCHLAAKAAAYFAGKGYPVQEMEGGFQAWARHKLPVE